MDQRLTPEQAQQIAQLASVTFRQHQNVVPAAEQPGIRDHLQALQQAQFPEQIRAALGSVRADLARLLIKPGADKKGITYCIGEITKLTTPSSREPIPHETVRLEAEEAPEVRMPGKSSKLGKTRKDSPSPEKARRKTPTPKPARRKIEEEAAPHGLVSEEDDITPVVATPGARIATPDISLRITKDNPLGQTLYNTQKLPESQQALAIPAEAGTPGPQAPQAYRRYFEIAQQVLNKQQAPEALVAALQQTGALTFDREGRPSPAHLELCRYLDGKGTFSEEDEKIAEALAVGLEEQKKGISPRFKNIARLRRLGNVGANIAEALRNEKSIELVKRIGKGGMGSVLIGNQMDDEKVVREVAVKIVTQPGKDPAREYLVAGVFKQKDPVVLVLFGGMIADYRLLVMEYLDKVRDLQELPENLELLPRLVACHGMAKSVLAMHKRKVLHKDIKPANFLVLHLKNGNIVELQKEVEVYGSDFGLARPFDKPEMDDPNTIEGTPLYMSPEQASCQTLTPASDVFSLGISMYNVLTGALPYPVDTFTSPGLLFTHIRTLKSSPIKRDDEKLKGVPAEVIDLLVKMTHPKPEKRVGMQEAEAVFAEYITSQLPKEKEAKKTKAASTRRGVIAGVTGAALLGVLASMPLINKSNRREEFQKAQAQALKGAEEAMTARNWQDAITLLEAEKARIIGNDDLSASERQSQLETVEGRLRAARSGLEALQRERREAAERADRLIGEGDALLAEQKFAEARAKYDEALRASADRAGQVREKKNTVDRQEVAAVFAQGVRSYHMGEPERALEAFARLEEPRLRAVGLAADQQRMVQEMRRLAHEWDDDKRAELSNEVVRLGDLAGAQAAQLARLQLQHLQPKDQRLVQATRILETKTQEFVTAVQRLQANAQGGNRDAYMTILELYRYLKENVPPIVAERLRQRGASSDTASDELKNNPEVLTYNAKDEAVRLAINILAIARRENRELVLYPGSEMRFQFAHGQEIVFQQSEVTTFLDLHDYPNAQIAVMTMVQIMDLLMDNIAGSGGDLVPSTPEPNLTAFVTARLTQVGMALQLKFPNNDDQVPTGHKVSLLRELRARPRPNADVTRTLEAFLR